MSALDRPCGGGAVATVLQQYDATPYNAIKYSLLTSLADVFLGIATAWIITFAASLSRLALTDGLYSAILALLFLSTAVGIRAKLNYVRST
jgi:hypothetical protein